MGVVSEELRVIEGSSSCDVTESKRRRGAAASSIDKDEIVSSTETVDLRLKMSETMDSAGHGGSSSPSLATTSPSIAPDPGELEVATELNSLPFTHETSFSSTATGSRSAKRISVNVDGNNIDEEHDHYDLSVAMMLGIRFSVEKSAFEQQKRIKAGAQAGALTDDDYTKTEKYVFPYSKDVLKK
jgi:hypothetical protein